MGKVWLIWSTRTRGSSPIKDHAYFNSVSRLLSVLPCLKECLNKLRSHIPTFTLQQISVKLDALSKGK